MAVPLTTTALRAEETVDGPPVWVPSRSRWLRGCTSTAISRPVIRDDSTVTRASGPTTTPRPTFDVLSDLFTTSGMAIHAGRAVVATGGCVQLIFDDAEFWYKTLDVGDEIYFHGSADPAERAYHDEPGITSEAPYHS
jgi:hypothetical protein